MHAPPTIDQNLLTSFNDRTLLWGYKPKAEDFNDRTLLWGYKPKAEVQQEP